MTAALPDAIVAAPLQRPPRLVGARLRYAVQSLGPIGWIGLALLAVAVAVWIVTALRVEPNNARAVADLAQRKSQLEAVQAGRHRELETVDPIGAVIEQLPPAAELPAFVESIQALAAKSNVRIERTEYRVERRLAGRALRYQLILPAHATYPQLRQWIEAVLHEHRSAALDEFSVRRETDGAAMLEARLVLSYYGRSAR